MPPTGKHHADANHLGQIDQHAEPVQAFEAGFTLGVTSRAVGILVAGVAGAVNRRQQKNFDEDENRRDPGHADGFAAVPDRQRRKHTEHRHDLIVNREHGPQKSGGDGTLQLGENQRRHKKAKEHHAAQHQCGNEYRKRVIRQPVQNPPPLFSAKLDS